MESVKNVFKNIYETNYESLLNKFVLCLIKGGKRIDIDYVTDLSDENFDIYIKIFEENYAELNNFNKAEFFSHYRDWNTFEFRAYNYYRQINNDKIEKDFLSSCKGLSFRSTLEIITNLKSLVHLKMQEKKLD